MDTKSCTLQILTEIYSVKNPLQKRSTVIKLAHSLIKSLTVKYIKQNSHNFYKLGRLKNPLHSCLTQSSILICKNSQGVETNNDFDTFENMYEGYKHKNLF